MFQARELEIQTHCLVFVRIVPTWAQGLIKEYFSEGLSAQQFQQFQQAVHQILAAPVPVVPAAVAPTAVAVRHRTPTKRHRTVESLEPQPSKTHGNGDCQDPSTSNSKRACYVCHQLKAPTTQKKTLWLGCGYTSPKTKLQDCQYWAHQTCLGIYFKCEEDLAKVPFYCPRHKPTKF